MKALFILVVCLLVVGASSSSSSSSNSGSSSVAPSSSSGAPSSSAADPSSSAAPSSSDPSSSMASSSMASSAASSSMASSSAAAASSSAASSDASSAASSAAAVSSSADSSAADSSAASSSAASAASSSAAAAASSSASSAASSQDSAASSAASSADSSAAAASSSSVTNSDALIPTGVGFTITPPIKGLDNVPVTFGNVAGAALAKVFLVLPDGTEYLVFGPVAYPNGQTQNAVMPELVDRHPGSFLKVVTISADGDVLTNECSACSSSPFVLEKGGKALDQTALNAARAGPPTGTSQPSTVLFFLRVLAADNNPLSRANAVQALDAIPDTVDASESFNILVALGDVWDNAQTKAPTNPEIVKLNLLVAKITAKVGGVQPTFSRGQALKLLATFFKIQSGFGHRSLAEKFTTQLTNTEQQAVAIPEVLRSQRLILASTDAAGGDFNFAHICSVVVTAANVNNQLCGGGDFPHIVQIGGANPATNNHRLTAGALNTNEMDSSDQRLTTALDLTSAVSPHYNEITTPETAVANPGYTMANTFDSTKGASSNDDTFKCYQRIATPNRDPSGTYNQMVGAGEEVRVNPTTVRCTTAAHSNEWRWITLAKATNNAGAGNAGAGAAATTANIATPSAPTARAVAASSDDDGSSTSGTIGGVFGGVGCLLCLLAIAAVVLLKAKGSKSSNAAGYPDAGDPMYTQTNGAYKVPASTPVYAANSPIIVPNSAPVYTASAAPVYAAPAPALF